MTPKLQRRASDIPSDPSSLKQRAIELFSNASHGNMGAPLYTNGGSSKYSEILSTNDQYVPYTGEVALIQANKNEIAEWAKDIDTVIIIGPGPSQAVETKEMQILKLLPKLKTVKLIDLSEQFNTEAKGALEKEFKDGVNIETYHGDFRSVTINQNYSRALVISTGSLTNFEEAPLDNFPSPIATSYLQRFHELAKTDGKVLWGYDSNSDKVSLEAEYNTPEISSFILYPLHKLGQTPGVVIKPEDFVYTPEFNARGSHLAHYWTAIKDQAISIDGHPIKVFEGDRFICFSSIKLNPSRLEILAKDNDIAAYKAFTHAQDKQVLHCFDCQ